MRFFLRLGPPLMTLNSAEWLGGLLINRFIKMDMLLVEQVKVSEVSPLITCLLEGLSGSGKTVSATTVGIDSDFPYVKIVSTESMIGLHESTKYAHIVKVFADAYNSHLSIIILDDIERLSQYVPIGPWFLNFISQTLLVLLKRLPPKDIFLAVAIKGLDQNFHLLDFLQLITQLSSRVMQLTLTRSTKSVDHAF